jgi:hypothetical protein
MRLGGADPQHRNAAFQEGVFLLKGRQRSCLPAIKRGSRAAQASPHLKSGDQAQTL